MASDRDHHGNVGIERFFNEMGEAFAVLLTLAEAVDDDEIGAGLDRVRNPRARTLEPADVEAAALCVRIEIPRQQYLVKLQDALNREALWPFF